MNNPDLQKWLLAPDGIATRLRALRGDASGKDFAEAAGMRASKLSKLELAQQTPTVDDIRAIAATAGQPANVANDLIAQLAQMPQVQSSARINRFGLVATQQRLNRLLHGSSHVRLFEATYLPRPVQTLAYATAVMRALAHIRGYKADAGGAASTVVLSSKFLHDAGRRFEVVIAEPALRWSVLPPAGMRAQLQQLHDLLALPNLDVRVLPFDQQSVVPPPSSFALIDGKGHTDTIEGTEELVDARLAGHEQLMPELLAASLRGTDAADFIKSAMAQIG